MVQSQPFMITEWDWFQLQLRLLNLERRGLESVTMVQFRDEQNPDSFQGLELGDEVLVVCYVCNSTTRDLVKKKETRTKQLEFYTSWVKSAKANMERILRQLPSLGKEFSTERNTAFLILNDYGMGSAEVCRFLRDKVVWLEDRIGEKS